MTKVVLDGKPFEHNQVSAWLEAGEDNDELAITVEMKRAESWRAVRMRLITPPGAIRPGDFRLESMPDDWWCGFGQYEGSCDEDGRSSSNASPIFPVAGHSLVEVSGWIRVKPTVRQAITSRRSAGGPYDKQTLCPTCGARPPGLRQAITLRRSAALCVVASFPFSIPVEGYVHELKMFADEIPLERL